MKTLIVSDRLKPAYPVLETEVVSWDKRPSVEAYSIVVLDLYFGEPSDQGYVIMGTDSARFYEMGAEVALCLKAGGIVIACLGPIAITPKALAGPGHRRHASEFKQDRLSSEHLPQPKCESSYDWLDQGLLGGLQLGHQFVKLSRGITWNVPNDRFYQIKAFFKSYVETFTGVKFYSAARATVTYRVEEQRRWDTIQSGCQTDPLILASAEHTNLPVAMSFNYNYFGGQLVLMPPFESPDDMSIAQLLAADLRHFGEWIYSTTHPGTVELPDWAKDYLAPPAIAIYEEISEHERRIVDLTKQTETYHRMLALLYGWGSGLENILERLFTSGDTTISVTRTEPGAHIDMFVQDQSGRSLAVEVTGVKGPLRHNDPHWADFLNYLPEHNAKNENGRVERIVLVVNTFRDFPPRERDRTRDMTAPVKKTAADNGICVVRSADLYDLWVETLEGLSMQEVFDKLFATEGIYDPFGVVD